jgi:hypothetical protein
VLTTLLSAALGLAGSGVPAFRARADDGGDAKAQALAERVQQALGGREAWEQTRYLKFDFFGRRSHLWDRWTGRHRVEGDNREGQHWIVVHNIQDKGEGDGQVVLAGHPAEGDAKRRMLQNAYAAWVNDTYWLLMPYKLQDPGVHLAYDGQEDIDGVTYDKLLVSFDHVGLTPGDRYWAYINPTTGLMDRWAFILQDQDPNGPPSAWRWEGWQRYGNILLAPTRRQVGGDERVLSLAPIEVPETVDEKLLTEP